MSRSLDSDGLTLKQRRFVAAVLETGNLTEAARRSYDTDSDVTAAHIGSENVRKPAVRAVLERSLREAGVTMPLLAERLYDGLNAKPNDPDRDHVARLGYLREACKLMDLYPTQSSVATRFNVEVDEPVEVLMAMQQLHRTLTAEERELILTGKPLAEPASSLPAPSLVQKRSRKKPARSGVK